MVSDSVLVLVAQSCPTLCDPMDCSPPGSSVHKIFQARIVDCLAILNIGMIHLIGSANIIGHKPDTDLRSVAHT